MSLSPQDYLSDFYVFNVDTREVSELSRDASKQGGPDAGFTQRATMVTDQCDVLCVFVLVGTTERCWA